jgi:hypothetical protein
MANTNAAKRGFQWNPATSSLDVYVNGVKAASFSASQGAAMTGALTALTHTAPGTPDYAIQDLVNTSAYGFVTKDEGNTVLSVIKNLQTRVGELEAIVEAYGLAAAN